MVPKMVTRVQHRHQAPLLATVAQQQSHHDVPQVRSYSTTEKVPKELIKQIREETAAPLGQILKALKETNYNVEETKKKLRELGMSIAAHKASRSAKEGVCGFVQLATNDYILFELNCETDFVARGEEFGKLISSVQQRLKANPDMTVDQLIDASRDEMAALTLKVGENITIPRLERFSGEHVSVYMHNKAPNADNVANSFAIVELSKDDSALGTNLAMHICGMTPLYTARDQVPESAIAEERSSQSEILKREQEKLADEIKEPEERIQKILDRGVEKWLKEVCLMDQSYLLKPKKSVSQILQESGVELKQWKRVKVGMK